MDLVFQVTKEDPEMLAAIKKAREMFPDFLAEADLGRASPILEDAMVKICIPTPADPEIGEHIWARYLGPVPDQDGRFFALLLNSPRKLKPMAKGDRIDFSIRSLSDWLYVTDGKAHGAFTVQLLRSRMKRTELRKHDAAYPFSLNDGTGRIA
jgi:uncharacterized protein YegJ (DUF2314 family)